MTDPIDADTAEGKGDTPSVASTPPLGVDDVDEDEVQARSDYVAKIKQRSQSRFESGTPRKQSEVRSHTSSPKPGPSKQSNKGEQHSLLGDAMTKQPYQTDSESEGKDDESDESKKSKEYEVERILTHRTVANTEKGEICEYKIKWKGYSAKYNTWEPSENLNADALLQKYWAAWDRAHPKVKEKEPAPSKTASAPKKGRPPKAAKGGPAKARTTGRTRNGSKKAEHDKSSDDQACPPPKRNAVQSKKETRQNSSNNEKVKVKLARKEKHDDQSDESDRESRVSSPPPKRKAKQAKSEKMENESDDDDQSVSPPPKSKVHQKKAKHGHQSDDSDENEQSASPHKRKTAHSQDASSSSKSKRRQTFTASATPNGKTKRPRKSGTAHTTPSVVSGDEDVASGTEDDDEDDVSGSEDDDYDDNRRRTSQKSRRHAPPQKSSVNPVRQKRSQSKRDKEEELDNQSISEAHSKMVNEYLDKGSWEQKLDTILTVERVNDQSDAKMAHLLFENGDKFWVDIRDVYTRAPQAMLLWYDKRTTYR